MTGGVNTILVCTAVSAILTLVNLLATFRVYRAMKAMQDRRNTLEQALAETNKLRQIAMGAIANYGGF